MSADEIGRRRRAGRAVGELAVIVVGVLIAFWVENFRQDLEDRREEQILLEAFQDEYALNRAGLEEQMGVYRRRAAAQRKILELGEAVLELPIDSATVLWAYALRIGNRNNNNAVLSSALGSGGLSLIRDPELRLVLAQWPGEAENLHEWETFYNEVVTEEFLPWMRSVSDIPPRIPPFSIDAGQLADGDYSAAVRSPMMSRFLNDLLDLHIAFRILEDRLLPLRDDADARIEAALR